MVSMRVGAVEVQTVRTAEYLGGIVDSKLSWRDRFSKAENHAELKRKKSMENENDYEYSKDEFMSFPDVYRPFLKRKPEFTEADMRGEIVTLFATGTDTVVNQASYFLMAMGQYPEYQDKLYEEITSVVGPDDDVSTDHIRQMTYLDQCFQETLRSFTLVPLTIRKTSEEIKLSDCTVPANQNIVLSLYGVHMNPKIFPNPERFDPERYSPENVASRGKHVNVAFSGGPRDCIGKQYASLLVKVLVVQILRKYKVTPVVDVHKLRVMLTIVITSMEGYFVELTPRH
ncbi:cytochrome P450 4c3-like [Macrosteles quadrilineatus]|uniref:cytochrome P450 4c3-like n=1 Tax=Macrosteles quadrilineatus TaxID=74068 RepID=UPI0023E0E4DB|nr:cytochrome P450 4c3-like [Macrosteles quadrilineatus]